MNTIPPKSILKIKPKEYLKQGFSHCGAYSVKGVLSAIGKDKTLHPKEYHRGWFGRLTGLTLSKQYWPKVFTSYGIQAQTKTARTLPDVKKLFALKSQLAIGNPIMVAIGNGYLSNGKYSTILGKIIGHWITVWGYDDEKQVFYVYDSAVPKHRYDKNIPTGNVKRTYREMLRDWKGSWLFRLKGFEEYHYIEIGLS